jgi:hypothetical protein
MGAAGGHMPHPFDLPQIKDGNDLINFFKEAIKSLKDNKANLKIDGVNASFKLTEKSDGTREFVGDRASLSPLDIQGLTVNNLSRRFKPQEDPETGELKPHGMVEAYTNLLSIFNETLPEIVSELKVLGMWDNPTLFFNTEYVEGQTNVLEYDHDFLAIHNVGQIYEKKSKKGYRPGIPRPSDIPGNAFSTVVTLDNSQQKALKTLLNKVKRVAKKHNFKIYGTVPIAFKEVASIDLERVLSENFTVMYDEDFNDSQTAPLKDWLNIAKNPRHKGVTLASGQQIGALSKEIYTAILNKESLSHFLSVPEGVNSSQMAQDAIDGAIFYHATRVLGREVLNALTSDMGDAQNHEGAVINDKKRFGVDMVKITGDFILGGMASAFRKSEEEEPFKCKRAIALVPGAYKPPHKEHLNMLKHYSKIANKVFLFVSPRARGGDDSDQYHVTREMSEKIWILYKKAAGLRNVQILPTDSVSPVKTSIDWIAKNYKREDCIILGASTKPDEKGVPDVEGRFDTGGIEDFLLDKHNITDEMVTILDPMDINLVHTFTVDMSATNFRKALAARDYEAIREYIPEEVDENQVLNILGIPPEPEIELEPTLDPESETLPENKKKEPFSSILYGLIEEVLNEQTEPYQRKVIAKHKKNRLTTKGPVKKAKPYTVNPPKKRSKSSPPLGEELEKGETWGGERRFSKEELEQWGNEATRIWKEAEQKAELEILKKLMREFDDKKFEEVLKSYRLTKPEIQNIIQGRNAFIWLNKYSIPTGYSTMTGLPIGTEEEKKENRKATLAWIEAGIKRDLADEEARKAREADTRQLEEEVSAIEFVAGRKPYEQACLEDPNCRELMKRKKINISLKLQKELEEIATAGGVGGVGSVEGNSAPMRRAKKKRKKHKQNEQLVNDVVNYLLENGS